MIEGSYDRLHALCEPAISRLAATLELGMDRWRGPTIADEEVAPFLRAVDAGLVALDQDTATVTFPGMPRATSKRYELLYSFIPSAAEPTPKLGWSWQELFTQAAAATELVLDHGWPAAAIGLEIGHLDFGAWAEDRWWLLGEAKTADAGSRGLAAMMAVFAELSGGAPAIVSQEARKNAAAKYLDLAEAAPAVFIEAAPGVRRAHSVDSDGTQITLTARSAVPGPP